jgi:ZIP family zinc transporter
VQLSFLLIPALFAVAALASGALGVLLTGAPDISRRIVPVSGAVLILISLVWILPELSSSIGTAAGLAYMLCGVALIWLTDRFVYPVCPSCSHTHDHSSCSTRLHGFATPLIAAANVHALFDGWAITAAQTHGAPAISLAVALHKVPESIAFAVILRAALGSRAQALLWVAATQIVMLLGSVLEAMSATYLGAQWITILLALAGGTFLYLGFHALHGEWKRRTSAHSHVEAS